MWSENEQVATCKIKRLGRTFVFVSICGKYTPTASITAQISEVPCFQPYLMLPHHKQKVHSLPPTMSTTVSGDYSGYSVYPSYYREACNTSHETQTQARSSNDNRHTLTQKPILTKGLSAPVLHHGTKGHFLVNSSRPAPTLNVNSLAPPSP